jgi:hypothetical protein
LTIGVTHELLHLALREEREGKAGAATGRDERPSPARRRAARGGLPGGRAVFSADTYSVASAPPPDYAALSGAEGVYQERVADPVVTANLEALLAEAKGLPIGSVRGHAVAHLKVDYVTGRYSLNGKGATREGLRSELARLALIGGLVFYYREGPAGTMPPEAEAAIHAICNARLPVTFTGRDYDPAVKVADYFLPEGTW